MKQHYAIDDMVEAVCKRLEPWAVKGVDDSANKFGIVVWYNNKQPGVVAFIFATASDMKITMTVDFIKQKMPAIFKMCDDIVEGIEAKQRERNLKALPIFINQQQPRPH